MEALVETVECPDCGYEQRTEVHVRIGYVSWVCYRCEEEVEVDGLEFGGDWPLKP